MQCGASKPGVQYTVKRFILVRAQETHPLQPFFHKITKPEVFLSFSTHCHFLTLCHYSPPLCFPDFFFRWFLSLVQKGHGGAKQMEITSAFLVCSVLSWFANRHSMKFLEQCVSWHRPPTKGRLLLKFRHIPAYITLLLPKSCSRLDISLWLACSSAQIVRVG